MESESTNVTIIAFEGIKKKNPLKCSLPEVSKPVKAMSLHDAIMMPGKWLPSKECLGKIILSPSVTCPPAISVVVCGEIINENAIELFKYYKIKECYVRDL